MGHRTVVRRIRALPVALAGAALLLSAACGSSSTAGTSSAATDRVHVATTSLGATVVAANGRTLYLLTSDKAGSTACSGSCLQVWPPVLVRTAHPRAAGVQGALGVLPRGASKQLTIAGHPVYTYAADSAPGKTAGEGIKSFGGTWWAISPSGTQLKPAASSGGGAVGGY